MNANIINLAGFGLALLLSGAYFGGQWRDRREIKEEIKELKAEHKRVLQQVETSNADYLRRQTDFLRHTSEFYATLDTILSQKENVTKEIRKINHVIEARKAEIDVEIRVLDQLLESRKIELEPPADGGGGQ